MTSTVPSPVFSENSSGDGPAAAFVRADEALQARDMRACSAALLDAMQAGDVDFDAVAARVQAMWTAAPNETEAILAVLTRAEERLGATVAVLKSRASFHEVVGHLDAAITTLQRLARLIDDGAERAAILEHCADLCRTAGHAQQALLHYQASFRADRMRASATFKAARLYLELAREEPAKQLLDVLSSQVDAGATAVDVSELAEMYIKVAEALLIRPSAHAVARDAVDRAARLAPDLARVRGLKSDLEGFSSSWKEHVRRLRDSALDARDKRDAARRYLAIAEIYAAFAENDPQLEQNVEKCLLLAPGYRPAIKFLEGRARVDGKLGELIERLKKMADGIRSVDVAVDTWLFVAVLLAERGAPPDELAGAYEKVRALDPRNVAAIQALTELHLSNGLYNKAAVVMEAFVAQSSDVDARRQTLRQLARLYELELNDPARATERLEALRDLADDDLGVIEHLADLYERAGDVAKHADALEQQLRLRQRREASDANADVPLLEQLLRMYQGPLSSTEKAFAVARRLFVLAPSDRLEAELVRLAGEQARGADLAATFLDAAQRASSSSDGRRLRLRAAESFLAAGDRKRARSLLDALLAQDPADRDATHLVDTLLQRDASPEEVASVLESRLKSQREPAEVARTLVALADALARMRRMDAAIERLEEALDRDPGQRAAYDKLEALLRTLERFDDVARCLSRRARLEDDLGDREAADGARLRLGRILEEKLGREDEAASLFLQVHAQRPDDVDVVRALERLLDRGVSAAAIAAALEPWYANAGSWRRHVEMIAVQRLAEGAPNRRAALARAMALSFEEKLKSPREAFDAWCDALIDEPQGADALAAAERLADVAQAWARFADVLAAAAEKLPDGTHRSALLTRRASLLQGVVGDQVAAIDAHKALLQAQPDNLASLTALADLYEKREAWPELRTTLLRMLEVLPADQAAPTSARLGLLLVVRFQDVAAARLHLERAAQDATTVTGEQRVDVLRRLAAILHASVDAGAADAEQLASVLAMLAAELAGKERSRIRAELGDILRAHLARPREALQAYEAAIANDPEQEAAWVGMRAILDDEGAPAVDRMAAGRTLDAHEDAIGNHVARAHVLGVLYRLEPNAQAKRAVVARLASLLVDEVETPDDALDVLLRHVASDADDEPARRQAESIASALQRQSDVYALYRTLRGSQDRAEARTYAERLAVFATERGDVDTALEALAFIADADPTSPQPWQRMIPLHERRSDALGIANCLERIAALAPAGERLARLLDLADHCFETLEDDARGLDALRAAHALVPDDDGVLARLESRLRVLRLEGPELASTIRKRADLQTQSAPRAALLLELGALLTRLGDATAAVDALTSSLRAERDGQSTARVSDLLQKLAQRDDVAGLRALDAIIEHHRAQRAWQPLVESLEIGAQKREAGEERAQLFDEISQMHESALRVPQLAFMATCRALRDAPTDARLDRARVLADATGSHSDLLEVLEDVAEALPVDQRVVALGFLREAQELARRLGDKTAVVRTAEALLALEPTDAGALEALESVHRAQADQSRLIDVLQRRVQTSTSATARRMALIELARLLTAAGDDAGAEQALLRILDDDAGDGEALVGLDDLYERTGNSGAHVGILERRIAAESAAPSRARLRTRLALLRFRRRGDPAGALDDLRAAVDDAPNLPEVRAGLEALLEHARSRGAPPVAIVAERLEHVLRTQEDFAAVPAVLELRLLGESGRDERGALLAEIAHVQERLGQPSLAFMAICRAVKEVPDDAGLRGEAERLAKATDALETLSLVYEDVLDAVRDPATRVLLHKRIATLAESVSGDAKTARQRLAAAVQAGANDVETLKELARLTRQTGTPQDLSSVLLRLAESAVLEADLDAARDAFGELCDVDENMGNLEGAIRAARELLALEPGDRTARGTLDRLLTRAERWPALAEHFADGVQRATNPNDAAGLLARLAHVQLDRLRDFRGALESLARLADAQPSSEALVSLGARALVLLAGDARVEARPWRAQLALLLEPRYESQGSWAELAPVLRLRLEVEQRPEDRKRLWTRIIDVEERLLNKPEAAMISLSRALGEDPADTALRERAERLSVRLHDLESLLGLYEDIIARLPTTEPLRVTYANRCGELYEGGIGDPVRAAEMYEQAFVASAAQDRPATERLTLLDRVERLYRAVGDPPRLAAALKRRAELVVQGDAAAARQALFEAATMEMHGLQDFGACIATLRRLLEIAPHDLAALRLLGEACERQSRWSELAEALERELVALGATDPQRALAARFKLGVVLDAHLDLPDDANAQFQAILEVRPDHRETQQYLETRLRKRDTGRFDSATFLQQSYEKTGDWSKAVDVLQATATELEKKGEKRELKVALLRIVDLQEHKLNSPDLAFMTLCRALKVDPTDQSVRERLRRLAIAVDTVDDVCELFEDEGLAADVAGKPALGAELREAAASIYAQVMGDLPRAIAAYEAILEKNPGRLVPLEALSELYPRVGRYADLEKALRRRLMFRDDAADRAPILVSLAAVLADHLGRVDEAVPLLDEVRRADGAHTEARRLLLRVQELLGNHTEVRLLLEEELAAQRTAESAEGIAQTRHRLAVLLTDVVDDAPAAVTLWEEIRGGMPALQARDDVFIALDGLYTKLARWPDLKALYEDAMKSERDPARLGALTAKLGDVLSVHLGGKDEAVARHLKQLELDPQNAQSLEALRALYADLGRWEELIALLRRMMRMTGDAQRLKGLRFQLAEVLGQRLGKRTEAVEAGRRILDIEPHTADELARLAEVFRHCEAWDELADSLDRQAALVQGPARVDVLLDVADVFEQKLKRPRLAGPAYEKLLQVEGRNDRAYRRLCEIYGDASDWQRLIGLKEERVKRTQDVATRVGLLREIGSLYADRLDQKSFAFLAASRAFHENFDDADVAAWMDRLAIESDSVDELVTIYDDALEHLTQDVRLVETHLRLAEIARDHLASPPSAEQHFRRTLEYDGTNVRALEGLAGLYRSLQRWRDLVATLERRVEMSLDVSQRIEWLRQIASVHDVDAHDVDAALQTHRRILELDGTDQRAYDDLAAILEREQRWPLLVDALKRNQDAAPTVEMRNAIRARIAMLCEQQLQNPDQAIATWKATLDEDAGNLPALRALERLYAALDRPTELLKVFERMVELTPPDEQVKLLGRIASLHEERFENLPAAIEANQRLLFVDGQNLPAVRNLERLFRATSQWEPLIQAYELHLSLTRDRREILQTYLLIGEVYAKELGRTDRAEAIYNAALEFEPSSKEAVAALGALYEKSGNWFNALEKLQTEAQLKGATPEAVETYYRIGKINEDMLLDQGNAVIAYKAALQIEPGHLQSIQALRDIALSRDDRAEYLKWLRTEAYYTREEMPRTEVHTRTGVFLQDVMSDLEGASQEFEQALAITPDHLAAARPLADICFRDENWPRAEQIIDIIVERLDAATETAELCRQHYRLGYICEKLEKEAKALKNYQRAYEFDPTYLPALEGLGAALSKSGRWEDASKIYQAILIHHRDGLTDAEVVDYYQQLADLNHKLLQTDRALKNLDKALELDPNHPPSLRLLASVYESEQRFEDAYDVRTRLVPHVAGEERVNLLVEIGRLAKSELDDPYRSIDAYEDANRQRPGDRDILTALLGLYRQTRQGPRAVEVLEELVRVEADEKVRVRLNQTLGEVWRDEMKNDARAVQYFNAALDLDPTFIKAFESIETLLASAQNWAALEENYIAMLKRIPQAETRGLKAVLWKNLGELYRYRLKNLDGALQAYRVLCKMQPDNLEALEVLADLLGRAPTGTDEALSTWQRLLVANPDKMQRPLHEIVRLALVKQQVDRALVFTSVLKVINDAQPKELELWQAWSKQAPPQARRAMTEKLWEVLLVHPDARGPLAQLSSILWRTAGSVLARQPKDYGLDKRKMWEPADLDAPVPKYFVTQLKYVRGVLALGNFQLFERVEGAEPLSPLCLETPTLAIGRGHPLLRETQSRVLWFQIARQVSSLRPAFMLPRTLGAQRFNMLVEMAIRLVEPRYPVHGDPKEIAEMDKALARVAQPLANALQPVVAELMKARQLVSTKPFLEGMEHTAIRTAYLLTGDLDLCVALLRQPDPGAIPLAFGAKLKELLLFATSDDHLELRQRLGLAVGAPGAGG